MLDGHVGEINIISFAPSGKLVASGSGDNTVRLWSTQPGMCLHVLECDMHWVWDVAFSPDGKLLAAAGMGEEVIIWGIPEE